LPPTASQDRLTGGEPLLRRNLERLVASLAEIPGMGDPHHQRRAAARKAAALKAAGLAGSRSASTPSTTPPSAP
jgi:molybdenum cofactor biosynthesis enzyme MoaA